MIYPFSHECQWSGPYYVWSSNQVDEAPPPDCKPVWECSICGASKPAQTEERK